MFRRVAIIVSILGAIVAIYVVATAQRPTPAPPPAQPPSTNPYARAIVAIGIVEPADRVVEIAAPEPGRVVEVFAQVNDHVDAGAPLFRIDGVPIEAELMGARAAVGAAQAELERLEQSPRAEDIPPAETEVEGARQRLADAEDRFKSLSEAMEKGGASDDEYRRQKFLVETLRSSYENALARLARIKAGAWSQDIAVARANLETRLAQVRAAELRLARLTVRAPSAGTILKRNIEPGEYASVSNASASSIPGDSTAPFILGNLNELHVRAQVDEEDTPLLRKNPNAIARVRGPIQNPIPLHWLRVEPLARPKLQITGASTELIDTRVVEVVFIAEPAPDAPTLYPGQIVDVFIDAGPESNS